MLIEDLYTQLVAAADAAVLEMPSPFPRLTYAEAMERFGSDKPDLRYGLEIADLTSVVRGTEFQVFAQRHRGGRPGAWLRGAGRRRPRGVATSTGWWRSRARRVPGASSGSPSRVKVPLEGLTAEEVRSPIGALLRRRALAELGRRCGARAGDLLLIAADQRRRSPRASSMCCAATWRRRVASRTRTCWHFAFDHRVPDVRVGRERRALERGAPPLHVAVRGGHAAKFETDPGAVRSNAYDLVCNG